MREHWNEINASCTGYIEFKQFDQGASSLHFRKNWFHDISSKFIITVTTIIITYPLI